MRLQKARLQKTPNNIKNLRRKGANSTIILYAIRDLKGEKRGRSLVSSPHVGAAEATEDSRDSFRY